MSDDIECNSYFGLLPAEILIKILGQVDTVSLVNFYEAYTNYGYILRERSVIRNVDFSKRFEIINFPLCEYLSDKFNCCLVTSLDISCIYWVPAAQLRRLIKKFTNLESLYAIDTNLDITTADILAYQATKVSKLAVTTRITKNPSLSLQCIKTLYLKFLERNRSGFPFHRLFPNLEKLWVVLIDITSLSIDNYVSINKLNKIVYQTNHIHSSIKSHDNCIRYYETQRFFQPYVVCLELFENPVPFDKFNYLKSVTSQSVKDAWQVLFELDQNTQVPYSLADARRLYLNQVNLETIRFEQLNFTHQFCICANRYYQACKDLLMLLQLNGLKKLSIMDCLLEDTSRPVSEPSSSFKQKRIGLDHGGGLSIFNNFFQLEELEIFCCGISRSVSCVFHVYPQISNLKYLTSLTIEVPVYLDGTFLIDILRNCKLLEILRISSIAQNENLNFNVCKAIPHGTALRDFRYFNHRIQMDRLIESLCTIETTKLQRIFFKCKVIDKFSSKCLTAFMERNPQLVFVYFIINDATKVCLKTVQQTLNVYSQASRGKVFLAQKACVGRCSQIPYVHYADMIAMESRVATMNNGDFYGF